VGVFEDMHQFMKMFSRSIKLAALAAILLPGSAMAANGYTNDLSASLRLGIEIESEPDFDLALQNFGSRIKWAGSADISDSSKLIGYLEYGFDQVDGVFTTRQAWVGISSGFGTVTGGKQYTAFYDAVSSKVDVAYVGSCAFEIRCARELSVLKYAMNEGGPVQLLGSVGLVTSDTTDNEVSDTTIDNDRDVVDSLDLAAKLDAGALSLSGGVTYQAENLGFDRGFAVGVAAATTLDFGTVSATVQFADNDFARTEDDAFGFTTAFQSNRFYGLFSIYDADTTPFFATAGYVLPIVQDRGLVYFELNVNDRDVDGEDTRLFARSVLVFNFGTSSSSGA